MAGDDDLSGIGRPPSTTRIHPPKSIGGALARRSGAGVPGTPSSSPINMAAFPASSPMTTSSASRGDSTSSPRTPWRRGPTVSMIARTHPQESPHQPNIARRSGAERRAGDEVADQCVHQVRRRHWKLAGYLIGSKGSTPRIKWLFDWTDCQPCRVALTNPMAYYGRWPHRLPRMS
jgi:hypothetical protein